MDIIVTSEENTQLQAQACHLPHILNKEKQVDKLLSNSSRGEVEIVVNCNDENVNNDCSPGFYNLIVKPCLLKLSPGFQVTCRNLTFELTSITPHIDQLGVHQSIILKFIFMMGLMEYGVTIGLHHTTQKVQIQGGSSMPDGSTAATFLLKYFITDLFNTMSADQKEKIDLFNAALLDLAKSRNETLQKNAEEINPKKFTICSVCSKDMAGNSKIVPCPNAHCLAKMHTKCFRKHVCYPAESRKRPLGMTSFLSLETDNEQLTEPNHDETSAPPCDDILSYSPENLFNHAISLQAAPAVGSICATFSQASTTCTSTYSLNCPVMSCVPITTASIDFVPTFSSLGLSTASAPFQILGAVSKTSLSSLPPKLKRVRQSQNPETAQIEFLEKELAITQTKITALEGNLKRKEVTCKIQEDRIRSLEHPAISSMFEKYFPSASMNHGIAQSCIQQCPSLPILNSISSNIEAIREQVACLTNSLHTL